MLNLLVHHVGFKRLMLILHDSFLIATQWKNPAAGCSSTRRFKTAMRIFRRLASCWPWCTVQTFESHTVTPYYVLGYDSYVLVRQRFVGKKYFHLQSIFTAVLYLIYW